MSTTAPDSRISAYAPVVPTASFAAGFPVFNNGDLSLIVNGVIRTDATVSATYANGISTNARMVLSSGVTGKVFVVGARPARRASRFTEGVPIPTRDLNLAFDTLEAEVQELGREAARALKTPFGEPTLPPESVGDLIGKVDALKSAAYQEASAFATASHTHAVATQTAAGFMSATDKDKLDHMEIGAPATPLSTRSFELTIGQSEANVPGGYGLGTVFIVALNGALLEKGLDWVADDGAKIVLSVPITADDIYDGQTSARLVAYFAKVYGEADDFIDGGTF